MENPNVYNLSAEEGYFIVTRVHRDDIRSVFKDKPELLKKVDQLTDADMIHIAGKLEEDYCNQLFWGSLECYAEGILEEKKE